MNVNQGNELGSIQNSFVTLEQHSCLFQSLTLLDCLGPASPILRRVSFSFLTRFPLSSIVRNQSVFKESNRQYTNKMLVSY